MIGGGVGLALQWKAFSLDATRPWGIAIAPAGGFLLRGWEELAAGGAIVSGGMTGSFRYRLDEGTSLSVSGQLNNFGGVPTRFNGFELDRAVDQGLGTVDLELARRFGDRWEGIFRVVATRFFRRRVFLATNR